VADGLGLGRLGLLAGFGEEPLGVVTAAGGLVQPGLPAVVLDYRDGSGDLERLLLVEVKHTGSENKGAVHAGVTDVLAYLYDSDTSLSRFPSPRALVVAWGISAKGLRQ
jgi:hypothetical protein